MIGPHDCVIWNIVKDVSWIILFHFVQLTHWSIKGFNFAKWISFQIRNGWSFNSVNFSSTDFHIVEWVVVLPKMVKKAEFYTDPKKEKDTKRQFWRLNQMNQI